METPLTFVPAFEDIRFQKHLLARVLGFDTDDVPEPFASAMDIAIEQIPSFCSPTGGFTLYDFFGQTEHSYVTIKGVKLSTKPLIARDVNQCKAVAVLACTAGEGVTEASRQAENGGDSILAFTIDAVGSLVVEAVSEYVAGKLAEQIAERDWGLTDIFSPGHCGWPVSDQTALFSLLPASFCGINLTDSCLMTPVKSISGIIGIGPHATRHGHSCERCNLTTCLYRGLKQR